MDGSWIIGIGLAVLLIAAYVTVLGVCVLLGIGGVLMQLHRALDADDAERHATRVPPGDNLISWPALNRSQRRRMKHQRR